MADDKKIPELNEAVTVVNTDLIALVTDVAGTAEVKKMSRANLIQSENIVMAAGKSIDSALEGKSIDIVQVSDSAIIDNDTLDFVFDIVPSKIVINFSGACERTTSGVGHTTGSSILTITGTNTFTSNMNYVSQRGNGSNIGGGSNDSTNVCYLLGGTAGSSGTVAGTATWTTATKTLRITWQETSTITANTVFQAIATAYK